MTKWNWLYRIIRGCVKVCYPKIRTEGLDHLPQEPVIIVGNHSQMNGPIACELYGPGVHYTWCAGQMMHRKEVPAYAYQDFWSYKPGYQKPFYKLLSYLIVPLCVCVFQNANTIGVYHDGRVLSTFQQTVKRLREGANVIIFPEKDVPYNHFLYEFQDRFVDVAKLYYKRTGRTVAFVPMYLAPELKTMYLGEPVRFDPEAPIDRERSRITGYLMEAITGIACSLPRHRVVPYRNVPKREYPYNLPEEKAHMSPPCGG